MFNRTSEYMAQFAFNYKGASPSVQNFSGLLSTLISANSQPLFWYSPDAKAGRAVIEGALGFAIPPPITYTYDSRGHLVPRQSYPENPVAAYFAVLFEQLWPW